MAEIGNVRPTNPINWPKQPKAITPADQKKDQHSDQQQKNKKEKKDYLDEHDDDNHLDEYA